MYTDSYQSKYRPRWVGIYFGAGGENRTRIACLEGRHISHYTTPACSYDYTSFTSIIKSTTMLQQFIPDDDTNHFHSSGYAAAAHGRTIGAASAQSYRERLHIERNRQHVNRYGHSMLGRPVGDVRPRDVQPESETLRARLNTGPGRSAGPVGPRPGGFREPTGRGYNPYL